MVFGTIETAASANQYYSNTKLCMFGNAAVLPWIVCFFFLYTCLWLSLKSRQNLDSSVQSTSWKWKLVLDDMVWANLRRQLRSSKVKAGCNIGLYIGTSSCTFTTLFLYHEVDFVKPLSQLALYNICNRIFLASHELSNTFHELSIRCICF